MWFSDVVATDDPAVAFKDIDAAFLVGAMPRKEGMERKDLLAANVKIFKAQVRHICLVFTVLYFSGFIEVKFSASYLHA